MRSIQIKNKEIRFVLLVFILIAVLIIDLIINNTIKFQTISILNAISVLLLLSLIAYYTLSRISRYIIKSNHLSDILSVIRNVNQLIIREKNIEKLIQNICDILVTNRVYSNAWVVLYDENQRVKYLTSADKSENFIKFKNKLEDGWVSYCIQHAAECNEGYLLINNTKQSCTECPFVDLYEDKGAYSIQLKYNDKIYGNLTLSMNSANLKNQEEIALLQEVAGDISYALYNLEMEEQLLQNESSLFSLKALYENIIDSVDNIIFVKDKSFKYIVCNQAFEKFAGKSNHDIVGKTDYEIFDKELADFFRDHDEIMLAEKQVKSNFEWVTYPDGQKVYLFTVKSPLLNSNGDVLGLVGNSVDLTEQKNAEEALKESQDNYKLLADNALDLIWKMDMNITFTFVNPAVKELLGYEEEEVIGTKLYQHCSKEEFKKIHLVMSELLRINSDEGKTLEVPMYKKDGSIILMEVNGKLIFDNTHSPIGFQGSARDFTLQTDVREKLKEALASLEKKSNELQTIIQEAPNPIMLHNESGKVVMVNRIWLSLSGYTHEEIDSVEKWAELACSKDKPLMHQYMDILYSLKHKIDMGESSVTTKDGNTLIWQFSSAPLGIINGERTVVTSAMDITELKKKDELMMAQSRHAAMGEMIGMIAHQWRQPIAGIAMDANNMLLDIAFDSFDTISAASYAQNILDQSSHLSKTIDDFRNFFKPDKSVSAIKVEDIIEETLAIVKESLFNNTIALKTSFLSETHVNAYPRELMQVFVNLINNAKDSLTASHTNNALIEITIYDEKEYVTTEICDNGGGIDEVILPKIFDPYFSTKDEKTGTGLGLYMSKMIVEEHLHGFISASNNKDGGACFKVQLLKNHALTNQY